MRIAISGAGIAGPTLAHWLLRAGHEPILIEKAPRFRTGGYIIDFWGVGYTIAERMGILPQVLEAGYDVQRVRMVDDRGRRSAEFSADVFRRMTGGRYTSLQRGELAEAIYASIRGRVEALFDERIEALDEGASGVRVSLANGPAREVDLVVGADGLHSAVRELAFGPQRRFEKRLGYRVAVFEARGYRPRDELVYVSHNAPGRLIARFALRDDRTMFMFVFTADRIGGDDPQDAERCKAMLREVYSDVRWEREGILAAMAPVEDIYYDGVDQIRMDTWSRGRVMLIGDAASSVSLLAGEGTGLAMTQAYVLAGELHRADGDYRDAFRRHEARLRPFIDGKQVSAAKFASTFAPQTRFGLWFRNQAARLMDIPPLADLLIGRDLRDDFDLPDYGL